MSEGGWSMTNFQNYKGAKYDRLSNPLLISETSCVTAQGGSLGTLAPEPLCPPGAFGHLVFSSRAT